MADQRGTNAAVLTDPTTGTQQAGVDASGNLQVIAAANGGVDIGDVTVNGPLGGGAEAGAILVTIANDSTGLLSIDDNAGSITVDNGGTFVVQEDGAALTALQLIDDAYVAQGTALGATKNVMAGGSVTTAAPTYTTGQISPLSLDTAGALRVTGGGGGTEYVEDAAAAANPTGNALIVIREDARAGSLTTTDGDNVALRGNNSGELYTIDTDANALLTTIDTDTGTIAGDTTSLDGKITACDTGAVVISSGTVTTVSTVTNLSQLGGTAISMNTGVRDAGTQRVTIATDDSVPTVVGGPTNPGIDTSTISALAAGSTTTTELRTADLVTKKLHQAVVSGSVPFKAVINTLNNGAATEVATLFGDFNNPVIWNPAHPDFVVSGSGAGADGFEALVTNLDPNDAADFYASFSYAD